MTSEANRSTAVRGGEQHCRVIRFHFRFKPPADVEPWGDRRLHWFALTDGWFWIEEQQAGRQAPHGVPISVLW
ncbi:DUF5984 family protein [Amycolatopsis regifaucium]|uniref:DUF5984 family protein n=1 Tax=Amycolatopsis regifaucium TaxID=546365 RepID=UPI003CC6D1C5